jgi:hypothetical protein
MVHVTSVAILPGWLLRGKVGVCDVQYQLLQWVYGCAVKLCGRGLVARVSGTTRVETCVTQSTCQGLLGGYFCLQGCVCG